MDLATIALAAFFVGAGLWLAGRHRIRWMVRTIRHVRGSRVEGRIEDQRRLVEAIAVWTESLRDAIAGSAGIEHAIIMTGRFSPEAIAPQVSRLVATLRYEPLAVCLKRFAGEVGHPTCDFVVVALVTAAENQTREMAQLLSHLSECARAECESYLRVWVSRARSRSAVRIISWSVIVFIAGLFLFNRAYLQPYASRSGAVFACLVMFVFGVSFHWLRSVARVNAPTRLFSHALAGG